MKLLLLKIKLKSTDDRAWWPVKAPLGAIDNRGGQHGFIIRFRDRDSFNATSSNLIYFNNRGEVTWTTQKKH